MDHEAFLKRRNKATFWRKKEGQRHQKFGGQLFHWALGKKYVFSLRTIAKGDSRRKTYAQSTT